MAARTTMNTINTFVFNFYMTSRTNVHSITTQTGNNQYTISTVVNEPRIMGIGMDDTVNKALLEGENNCG